MTTDPPRVAAPRNPLGSRPRPHPVRTIAFALLIAAIDALLLAAALDGVSALLAHHRALALLALWTLGGVTLALLRPVAGQDVVERDAESPGVMLALLVVPLVVAPAAAIGERLGLWLIPGPPAWRWIGVALSGIGFAIRIAAMRRLGARFSPRVALQRDHALETGGLYARIRHPGYLGAWLIALGGALAFGGGIALPLVLVMGLLLRNRARREDAMLERRFGDGFRAYRDRTGRFFPRLNPPAR
ncbi:MAG: isoprenylcysteine carboxylmethyltransferase family protein [Candidatus Eisenbacteria bacterium]|nr:isoprenylcysteine carboxylmethyltransferase family protein [Candidatus Eisenbacteria bacterium]